jgi:hypothetical protein
VDAEDRIVGISGAWDKFARENDGRSLVGRAVLNANLWQFVTGLENRLVYRQIMDYVRARTRVVRFLFRCDGPDHCRLVGMRVAPEPNGGCSFETSILCEHRRPHLPLLDARSPKSSDTIALCNWCMRADCGPLGWRDLSDPAVRAMLREPTDAPRPVFTICPECLAAIRHALS